MDGFVYLKSYHDDEKLVAEKLKVLARQTLPPGQPDFEGLADDQKEALTIIKRQDEGLIIRNCHRTKNGEDIELGNSTARDFFVLKPDGDEKPTRLTGYQLDHLRDASKFRAREKARGVGFSFV